MCRLWEQSQEIMDELMFGSKDIWEQRKIPSLQYHTPNQRFSITVWLQFPSEKIEYDYWNWLNNCFQKNKMSVYIFYISNLKYAVLELQRRINFKKSSNAKKNSIRVHLSPQQEVESRSSNTNSKHVPNGSAETSSYAW